MMKVKAWGAVSVLVLLALLVPSARAAEFVEGGEVVIPADQIIEDDLYVSAGSFVLDGKVLGDLVVAASTIDVNGQVEGDVLAVGQSIAIDGTVTDDVRAAAAALQLGNAASIGGDAALAGFSLNALRGSRVAGDLMWGGGQALLAGEIGDDLLAGTAALLLDGAVGGDAKLGVGSPDEPRPFFPAQFSPGMPPIPTVPSGLSFGAAAAIAGNLDYTSPQAASVPSGVVAGQTQFTQEAPDRSERREAWSVVSFLLGRLRRFLALLLVGSLLLWLGRRALKRCVETLEVQPLASMGWGALAMVLALTALIAVLALTVLLAVVFGLFTLQSLATIVVFLGLVMSGLLILAAVVAIVWLAPIAVSLWLGRWVLGKLRPAAASGRFGPFVLGLVLYVLVAGIPVVGALVALVVAVWGLGAWALTVKDMRHEIRVEAVAEPSWF